MYNSQQIPTRWFVESLATQTLVIFIIRTPGKPWESRPSRALTLSVLSCVLIGTLLPFIPPMARPLGFIPLPPAFFLFLTVVVVTYLALVEALKRPIMRRMVATADKPTNGHDDQTRR